VQPLRVRLITPTVPMELQELQGGLCPRCRYTTQCDDHRAQRPETGPHLAVAALAEEPGLPLGVAAYLHVLRVDVPPLQRRVQLPCSADGAGSPGPSIPTACASRLRHQPQGSVRDSLQSNAPTAQATRHRHTADLPMDCLVRDWGREKVPCGLPLSMVRPLPFWWSCSTGAGASAELDALPAVTLPQCAFQLAHCADKTPSACRERLVAVSCISETCLYSRNGTIVAGR
jgi:hypothetical protein